MWINNSNTALGVKLTMYLINYLHKTILEKKDRKQNKWTMSLRSSISVLAVSLCKEMFFYILYYAKQFMGTTYALTWY